MARISTRSNPTNLLEIDKKNVNLVLTELGGTRFFSLAKLDLASFDLPLDSVVVCVARTGYTSQRFELGPLLNWSKEEHSLDDLDPFGSIRFRVLVHPPNSPKLLAAAENIRPVNDTDSESLLPMEAADLGQQMWRLEMKEDGPILKFNGAVFSSAAGVENYLPFGAFVLPEALRQVLLAIARDPDQLEDETDPLNAWGPWIDSTGLGRIPPGAEESEQIEWSDSIVSSFCRRHQFASRFDRYLSAGGKE